MEPKDILSCHMAFAEVFLRKLASKSGDESLKDLALKTKRLSDLLETNPEPGTMDLVICLLRHLSDCLRDVDGLLGTSTDMKSFVEDVSSGRLVLSRLVH
jgi:hypothetical protein